MPLISTLIHTNNDERRLGRTLETLRGCDEILVVDHGSTDKTVHIARQHGATIVKAVPGVDHGAYAIDCRHDWVLLLAPDEIVTESLEASLLQWKRAKPGDCIGYAINVRAQTLEGSQPGNKEMRLVNRKKINWQGFAPATTPGCAILPGDMIRLAADEETAPNPPA